MKILIFKELDSTMTRSAELLRAGALDDMDGVLAYSQTQGQGRLHRVWYTGRGENLAISYWVKLPLNCLPPLPLVVALAVTDALEKCGVKGLTCKWPNDIKVEGMKLGGILCRFAENSLGEPGCIVGIGINIGWEKIQLNNIDQPATSLTELTGQSIPPLELGQAIQSCLANRKSELHKQGFLGKLADEWYAHCAHADQEITVNTGFESITGITNGVSAQGGLLLDTNSGKREVICGDVLLWSPRRNAPL